MVIKGFPLHPFITQTTTVWVHRSILWVNPLSNTHRKTTCRASYLSGIPPPLLHNTNTHSVGIRNHCVCHFPFENYTEPVCGSIHLIKLLENKLRAPYFSGVLPPFFTTQATTVWAYGTTCKSIPPKNHENHEGGEEGVSLTLEYINLLGRNNFKHNA